MARRRSTRVVQVVMVIVGAIVALSLILSLIGLLLIK